jgi:peptidyl-prolyl cis-trans isomerase C
MNFKHYAAALALCLGLASCSSTTEEAPQSDSKEEAPAAAAPADPSSFPEVVAQVNDVEITKTQLLSRVRDVQSQVGNSIETGSIDFYRKVLDEMVGAELLYQSSHERKLSVGEAELNQQLDGIRSRFPNPEAFEQALQSEGLTLSELRGRMERDLSIQNLVQASIAPNVQVSEDAKRRYYDENPEQMREPDRLRLSHILKRVGPDATGASRDQALGVIEDLLEQARGGADFAALARAHSEDPGSAANGGEMVVARGETVPPFEAAAFALEPGGLSPVVETQFGYHIIKLSEKMKGALVPYEQVQMRIGEFLFQREMQEEVEREVAKLREGATVEIFIG